MTERFYLPSAHVEKLRECIYKANSVAASIDHSKEPTVEKMKDALAELVDGVEKWVFATPIPAGIDQDMEDLLNEIEHPPSDNSLNFE